jgi:hypothetical protein
MREESLTGIQYGTIAFVEILTFVATLVVGYIYVWKKGIFDWGIQARAEAREEPNYWPNAAATKPRTSRSPHNKIWDSKIIYSNRCPMS